ncbi:MAG: hypothetical protein H7Z37_06065 [Pyrinomonadaceae bacterium]|nr:hypothetical protein [Pyrinomonadaceae bacterium]
MKNSFLIVSLACLFVFAQPAIFAQTASSKIAPAAQRELDLWRTFTPKSSSFKISLPAAPEENSFAWQVAEKTVDINFLHIKHSATDFVVMSFYQPELEKVQEKVEDYVDKLNIAIDKNGGVIGDRSLSSRKDLTKNGVFGFETVFQNSEMRQIRSRFFMSKNRIYVLQVMMPDLHTAPSELVKVYQAEADKFFKSFQIIDNKPQIAKRENSGKGKSR